MDAKARNRASLCDALPPSVTGRAVQSPQQATPAMEAYVAMSRKLSQEDIEHRGPRACRANARGGFSAICDQRRRNGCHRHRYREISSHGRGGQRIIPSGRDGRRSGRLVRHRWQHKG
eukprot:1679210-Prymnesium_polylepis.2